MSNPRINIKDKITDALLQLQTICINYGQHLLSDYPAELAQESIRHKLTTVKVQEIGTRIENRTFQLQIKPIDAEITINVNPSDLKFLRSTLIQKLSAVSTIYTWIVNCLHSTNENQRLENFIILQRYVYACDLRKDIKAPRTGNTRPEKTQGAMFLVEFEVKLNSLFYQFADSNLIAYGVFFDNIKNICKTYLLHLAEKNDSSGYLKVKKLFIYDLIKDLISEDNSLITINSYNAIKKLIIKNSTSDLDQKADTTDNADKLEPKIISLANEIKKIITSKSLETAINMHSIFFLSYLPFQNASTDFSKALKNEIANLDSRLNDLKLILAPQRQVASH